MIGFGRFTSRGRKSEAGSLRQQAEREDARENFVGAAELWRALAETGDPEGCHVLGDRYERAQGVMQNFVEATRWFRKAAEMGHVPSQAKLGEIYFHGRVAPASVNEIGRR